MENSDILVVVPSYKRADVLSKYTYKWLSISDASYIILIRPDQLEDYKGLNNIVVLPENIDGLGYALKYAKDYASSHGYGYIFKVDDDVRGFKRLRRSTSNSDRTIQYAENFNRVLKVSSEILNKGYKGINFPYSNEQFSSNDPPIQPFKGKAQTCYIIDTELYAPGEYTATEDYTVQLTLFKSGAPYAKFYEYAIDLGIPVFGGTGGIQALDRQAMSNKEAEIIAREYPEAVIVYKNKTGLHEIDMRKTREAYNKLNSK